jgi:hypothetical protein
MIALFKDSNPDLFTEIHPSKNVGIDFSLVKNNSQKIIWWICKKNEKHVWEQSIKARVKYGYGCLYCSGRKTIYEESFGYLYPEIAKEAHPTKNVNFDPFTTAPQSNKTIWWLCSEGHEWQSHIYMRTGKGQNCRECHLIRNSLLNKYPQIAKEWHPIKNLPLTPDRVRPSSNLRVRWQCQVNSSHEWLAKIKSRTFFKNECPHCKKIKITTNEKISLLEYDPELCKQWHPTKNNFSPSEVTPGSNKKAWWQCPINPKHIWEASINSRVKGRGCRKCANRDLEPEDSLEKRFPIIAQQWHPTRNGNVTPLNVSYGSSFKAWWQCKSKHKHEWPETVHSRTQRNKTECPLCSKSRFSYTNSLESVYPEISAQWHPTKNGKLKPSDVSKASGKKVWWLCPVNPQHEWEAQIKNRTILKTGCRLCDDEKNIIRMSEHLFQIDNKDINYYHIFLNNIRSLQKLLSINLSNKRLLQPFYRMIYSAVITSIETYLSDAFIQQVFEDKVFIEKFVTTNPDLEKKQFNFYEAMNIYNNVEKNIKEYLLNIIWHNLPKISKMYKQVFNVEFPSDITFLLRAITIRHDFVHRSGKTKGGMIVNIDKDQIKRLILDSKSFVTFINNQFEMQMIKKNVVSLNL